MSKYTKTLKVGGNEYVVDQFNNPTRKVATYYGNSGRTKPTYDEGARDADRLVETDTGKVFIFDEDIKDWRQM